VHVVWLSVLQFLEGLSGWRRRWTMVLLCFVAFMLCNMDRVNMSIAILPMSQEYGWNTQTVGLVQSSFFWWVVCVCVCWGGGGGRALAARC
jgi:ACS family sodium-dependent inorganic phosphate cotransporter